MNSRSLIRHPGPETSPRILQARGEGETLQVTLKKGRILMEAVAEAMTAADCESGVMIFDGLQMGPFDYVMPGPSNDGIHAAWYSARKSGNHATILHGSAIVGRRRDDWWLHCHAVWQEGSSRACGHLLPDDVVLAADAPVTLIAFRGGAFDVALHAETQFEIFHPTGGQTTGNALIAKVHPHEDIHSAIRRLITNAGFAQAEVYGVGSLIGAAFTEGRPMRSPISEVLILPGAVWNGALRLPMYCVDPAGDQFSGDLVAGHAPVCVTFEVMILERPAQGPSA